jgi:hypothetical protein
MSKLTKESAHDFWVTRMASHTSAAILLEVQERTARECAEIAMKEHNSFADNAGDHYHLARRNVATEIESAFSLDAKEQERIEGIESLEDLSRRTGRTYFVDLSQMPKEPEPAPVQECGGCKHWQAYRPDHPQSYCYLNPLAVMKYAREGCGQWEAKC